MALDPALRLLVLLCTPLALAVLMLFHPSPYDDVAGELAPLAGWWTFLHTVQFLLFALMGGALWLLVEGLRSVAATVSRVSAAGFVVFYDIGDAVSGISTGIMAGGVAGTPDGERAVAAVEELFADPTKNLAFAVGIYAWVLALAAAGISLHRDGAPLPPLLLLAIPAFSMTFDHAFPFGSLTFASFFVVVLWLELSPRRGAPVKAEDRPEGSTVPEAG